MLDVMIGASSKDIRAEKTFRLAFNGNLREVNRRKFINHAHCFET